MPNRKHVKDKTQVVYLGEPYNYYVHLEPTDEVQAYETKAAEVMRQYVEEQSRLEQGGKPSVKRELEIGELFKELGPHPHSTIHVDDLAKLPAVVWVPDQDAETGHFEVAASDDPEGEQYHEYRIKGIQPS